MKEFVYKRNQRTGPAPVIKKLGAIKRGMEQTPLLFRGEPIIVESVQHSEQCNQQHIAARNLNTGEISPPFGIEYYFASAYAEGDTLYVFASSRRDDKPLTLYTDTSSSEWHDPRGGHEIRMFKTHDLKTWEEKDILSCPDRRFWNTSVCRGKDQYVMAIEVSEQEGFDVPEIGEPFTCFFAVSKDLENWEMLPDSYSYTPARYNACPALRYSNGYYYMICLEALPCIRYAPYIYRTRDFNLWEVGFHNPMMMWSDEDRIPKAGVEFSPEDLELLQTGLNINCSDLDLFEYEGKTHVYYSNGDQQTYSFLCEAVYDGPLDQFLEHFFK